MNKGEFVKALAESAGLTNKDAEVAYKAFVDVVTVALKKGETINLVGFGNFSVKQRAAKDGFNPLTKQKIKIPAKKVASFKFGKSFKDSL
ncbi:MAG: HU family DNA-binding protein [Christensenellaceae bacterium]|jgi:DNA-binding protein HU-beta|nr:HU family DNA-binding protein [Christensenellaceae bacterium]